VKSKEKVSMKARSRVTNISWRNWDWLSKATTSSWSEEEERAKGRTGEGKMCRDGATRAQIG